MDLGLQSPSAPNAQLCLHFLPKVVGCHISLQNQLRSWEESALQNTLRGPDKDHWQNRVLYPHFSRANAAFFGKKQNRRSILQSILLHRHFAQPKLLVGGRGRARTPLAGLCAVCMAAVGQWGLAVSSKTSGNNAAPQYIVFPYMRTMGSCLLAWWSVCWKRKRRREPWG